MRSPHSKISTWVTDSDFLDKWAFPASFRNRDFTGLEYQQLTLDRRDDQLKLPSVHNQRVARVKLDIFPYPESFGTPR
jgi:hypothetical protein